MRDLLTGERCVAVIERDEHGHSIFIPTKGTGYLANLLGDAASAYADGDDETARVAAGWWASKRPIVVVAALTGHGESDAEERFVGRLESE